MSRIRLDKLLVKRKFAEDIDLARELLNANTVLVNGALQTNAASLVELGDSIELVGPKPQFVSRAGFKLQAALEEFQIDLKGKRCLDIGASTGGFTDCMLQHGASNVLAVDVGKGQLDDKIRHNPNVIVMEKFNASDLTLDHIGDQCDFAAIDVSFTSVLRVIEPVISVLKSINIVVLIKPQFELPSKFVDFKGIVNDSSAHKKCIEDLSQKLATIAKITNIIPSPILGGKGNIEFLARLSQMETSDVGISTSRIDEVVEMAHQLRK